MTTSHGQNRRLISSLGDELILNNLEKLAIVSVVHMAGGEGGEHPEMRNTDFFVLFPLDWCRGVMTTSHGQNRRLISSLGDELILNNLEKLAIVSVVHGRSPMSKKSIENNMDRQRH